ncbi:CheY-like chemotaxis protein [Haloferula luteola]|uniref:CheY-like chemotaxis protein n=1 Tax=Haloferula luteola TaxID=595692 RepID=A0A840UXC7_9BACT|nr:response regulator [Haloferula luteola]MBB5350432.1 CheY-like chemotaxis protein [Haloferula luteola]
MSDTPISAPSAHGGPLKVLVVDDGRSSADVLGLFFELEGHQVTVVYDGSSALEKVREVPPDLIVMDLNMPGLSGYETAGMIREMEGGGGIHLYALSGGLADVEGVKAREAGFDGFLPKPVVPDDLRALLAGLPV